MLNFRPAIIALAISALLPLQALAAADCPPEKLAAAFDRFDGQTYGTSGFGAQAWRMVKGLGDPGIEPMDAGSYDSGEGARTAFKGVALTVDPGFDFPQSPIYGSNCLLDYPLTVLKARIATLGKTHAYVKQWLAAQSAVLAVCTKADTTAALPPLLAVDDKLKSLQAEDRAYQDATIGLYRAFKDYRPEGEAGLGAFRAIAASQSVHRHAARYMVAYVLAKTGQFKEARAETVALLADKNAAAFHHIARALKGYIAHEEDTVEGWSALLDDLVATLELPGAAISASEDTKEEYARALYDLDHLGVRARDDDGWLTGKLPADATVSKAIHDAARRHPMIAWMIAGQTMESAGDATPWQFVGPKWDLRASVFTGVTKALAPDLPPLARDMLDAESVGTGDAARASLWSKANGAIKAAAESCGTAAGTAAAPVLFRQALRASARAGRIDEANAGIDAAQAFKPAAAHGAAIRNMARYLAGKGLLTEARAFRDRHLADATDWEAASLKLYLAEDEAHLRSALKDAGDERLMFAPLNFLPAKTIAAFAGDSELFPHEERGFLAITAYARAYALGGVPDAKLADLMFSLNPPLVALRDGIAARHKTLNPARLRLLTILNAPRFNTLINGPDMGPGFGDPVDEISGDRNDRNWWCPFEPDRQLGHLRGQFDQAFGNELPDVSDDKQSLAALIDPAMKAELDGAREATLRQHPMIKAVSWKELAALAAAPSAPKRLTQRALDWAKAARPGDDAAAEALALAVRTTHYGCNWHGGHKAYSKPAQELLKAKFGASAWATQTPYWFDCQLADRDMPADAKPGECPVKAWQKQAPLK